MIDPDFPTYRLGINLAADGTGICAVDIERDGQPRRVRGLSVRYRPGRLPLASRRVTALAEEMAELIAGVAAEQGQPAKILISIAEPAEMADLVLSRITEAAGAGAVVHGVSDTQLADCLQEWKLATRSAAPDRRFSARRVAIEAFAVAIAGVRMADDVRQALRRTLPASLKRLVAVEAARSRAPREAAPVRRYLDIVERPDGRWTTVAADGHRIMRLFEDDLLMVGTGADQHILRVVRWGSRSNVVWLAPSNEVGDLRTRHHDPEDPLRCTFVPVGRLKSLSARKVFVDRIGRVRDASAEKVAAVS